MSPTPPRPVGRLTREQIAERLHDAAMKDTLGIRWNDMPGLVEERRDYWRRAADAVLAMLANERNAALREAAEKARDLLGLSTVNATPSFVYDSIRALSRQP